MSYKTDKTGPKENTLSTMIYDKIEENFNISLEMTNKSDSRGTTTIRMLFPSRILFLVKTSTVTFVPNKPVTFEIKRFGEYCCCGNIILKRYDSTAAW